MYILMVDSLLLTHLELWMAAQVQVVEALRFNPNDHLFDVLRRDGNVCKCGIWLFKSATCGRVYQRHPHKCGESHTFRGANTAYCSGCSQKSKKIILWNIYKLWGD